MRYPAGNITFLTILSLLILMGCSEFRKLQKSTDWREKYEASVKYYERGDRGDYVKASMLLEEILPLIRGMPEAEQANFYYAYCHFHQSLFVESAYYFKTFYETYSRSEFAMESMYMYAYSLFLDSPVEELDQSSSAEAIGAMQQFLNLYPDTKYSGQATATINELQRKLESKAYNNAILYKKLSQHNSAVIAFENFSKDFPDSKYNEEVHFLKLESQYIYARRSISTKQKERYEKAIEIYDYFIENYSDSKFAKEATRLNSECRKWMNEFLSKNQVIESNNN
ncbi:MAG: outer membrane protein assembly factor BamD [Cyclobacteriaceae bacterium]|nr:MAG: outer membrane protein assembly factor BamD [Cyclobacteriaceae bacterium]